MTDIYVPFFGQLAWIDAILLVWFALTAASVIYVAYDAFTNNPEMKIMRAAWVLVTLYLGPIARSSTSCRARNPHLSPTKSLSARSGNKVSVRRFTASPAMRPGSWWRPR